MAFYQNSGPVDCTKNFDTSSVKGKTAIVTGGAAGIGEAYVRALVKAGAYVIIADIDENGGKKLESELSKSATFAKCDVTSWENQAEVFKKAKQVSPSGRIDIVIANAGISGQDEVVMNDISKDEPDKPKIPTFTINALGVLYTSHLAFWYFRKQNQDQGKKDQSLVLQSSLAGYLDLIGTPQYTSAKFMVRGLMRTLRHSDVRVNVIAPWYIKTAIIGDIIDTAIEKQNTGYATVEDAATAMMRLVSDEKVNGRALAIMPRDWKEAPQGYVDVDLDDFEKGSLWGKGQEVVLDPFKWVYSQAQDPLSTQ